MNIDLLDLCYLENHIYILLLSIFFTSFIAFVIVVDIKILLQARTQTTSNVEEKHVPKRLRTRMRWVRDYRMWVSLTK